MNPIPQTGHAASNFFDFFGALPAIAAHEELQKNLRPSRRERLISLTGFSTAFPQQAHRTRVVATPPIVAAMEAWRNASVEAIGPGGIRTLVSKTFARSFYARVSAFRLSSGAEQPIVRRFARHPVFPGRQILGPAPRRIVREAGLLEVG